MTQHVLRIISALTALALLAACQDQTPLATTTPTDSPIGVTSTPMRQPFLSVAPDQAKSGDTITVIGTDWPAGANVALDLRPSGKTDGSITLGSATTDDQGRFRFVSLVPQIAAPGAWAVTASSGSPLVIASVMLYIDESRTPATGTVAPPTSTTEPTPTNIVPSSTPTRKPPTTTPRPPTATRLPPTPTPIVITEWRGDYWNNRDLSGSPLFTRNDQHVDFSWGSGSPDGRINADNFSARYSRRLYFGAGTYRFTLRIDDGARMWVDGVRVLDDWHDGGARDLTVDLTLNAGNHDLRIDYYEAGGQASIRFSYVNAVPATPIPTKTPVPTKTPRPTATKVPPTPVPPPTEKPRPTKEPQPTATEVPPTPVPPPTEEPRPTKEPQPTATEAPPTVEPTEIVRPTKVPPTPKPTVTPTPIVTRPVTITATLNGVRLTVIGRLWMPRERVKIYLISQEGTDGEPLPVALGRAQADRRGIFSFVTTLKQPIMTEYDATVMVMSSTGYSITVPLTSTRMYAGPAVKP